MNEDFLRGKLDRREAEGSLRQLRLQEGWIDFSSNDYLGIARRSLLSVKNEDEPRWHGSTGSRLLSGNYRLIEETENTIASFHQAEAGLIFNSGYDANLGLLSCVPQREDTIIYDQLSHASIRDGIRVSLARSVAFAHNDLGDLEKKLTLTTGRKFVVTESVFSMDGETAPLRDIVLLCDLHDALLIVDEAHATGVLGQLGEGLVQQLQLQGHCFARVHTFGKALGCHGAIVLGSRVLMNYLINFCRPFIYTTAMPAAAVAAVQVSYKLFPEMKTERAHLQSLAQLFRQSCETLTIVDSTTPIQAVIVPGNDQVRRAATAMQDQGIDLRPIHYPTVPKGRERLRVVLHAFNTAEEVIKLAQGLLHWQD